METRNSSSNSNNDDEPANKDATAAEKERLLREIKELKCIIKQCEWSLQTRFKDIEARVTKKPLQNLEVSSTFSKIPNVEVDLKDDLFRFAGIRCVKFRRDEFVFNFTSTDKEQKDNTYAVQIFVKDGKGKLGKWVMPMMIDINYILSKTPIDNLNNLTDFIKSCKHYVDCYTARQQQFLSLKERMSDMKHCTLESDMGFKQISLELYGVHDSENDSYINLIIYLLYQSDNVRPYKVKIDTINEKKLNDDIRQRLNICFKDVFKRSDLQTAFDKILLEDNSTFTWMQEEDTESPLELNDTSSSDEDFLVELQLERRRSLRKLQKKHELRKKWNERKKKRNITNIESSEDSQENSSLNAKKTHTESPQRILIKEKKAKKAISILKQKKINKNLVETTPLHKPKVKLKQTKLNFQIQETTTSNANKKSLPELKLDNKPDNKQSKITKLVTSTPLHHKGNIRNVLSSSSLEINNITSIETIKKTANKLDYSKDSDELGKNKKKTLEENIPEKIDRILRSSIKTPESSSKVSETFQRHTRSMTKK